MLRLDELSLFVGLFDKIVVDELILDQYLVFNEVLPQSFLFLMSHAFEICQLLL